MSNNHIEEDWGQFALLDNFTEITPKPILISTKNEVQKKKPDPSFDVEAQVTNRTFSTWYLLNLINVNYNQSIVFSLVNLTFDLYHRIHSFFVEEEITLPI